MNRAICPACAATQLRALDPPDDEAWVARVLRLLTAAWKRSTSGCVWCKEADR
jgi:hypothetical protein